MKMKSRFFPRIESEESWTSIDGSIIEAVDPETAIKLKRGVQKPPSSRRLAFMLGREKRVSVDRTDETSGAAYIVQNPTRQYDKEKTVARSFLGGDHHATQLSDSNRSNPLVLPRSSMALTGTSGLKEATRGGSLHVHAHVADEDAAVRFRRDVEEFVPDTRTAHDEAASQTIELRKAALQAGIGNFRIAHSGIDTLVPLRAQDDQTSRELIWDILTSRNDAPYTVAAKQLDTYVDMHVRNELRARGTTSFDAHTGAARTDLPDVRGMQPLPAQRGTRFTRDVFKTLVSIELEERDNPLAMERVGGWALGVLAASGEHIASLKQDGLRALGRLTMGLIDTSPQSSAQSEGRLAQRNDMDIPHVMGDVIGIAPPIVVYDVKDAMKNDSFRVALQALHDAAVFDEPADVIILNLADIMRREDLACSNDVAADILTGSKDAAQVFQKKGRDRVYTMHTPHATTDTPASLRNQSRTLTQQTRSVVEHASVADRHNQTLHASSRLLGMRDELDHAPAPPIVGNDAGLSSLPLDKKLTRTKY